MRIIKNFNLKSLAFITPFLLIGCVSAHVQQNNDANDSVVLAQTIETTAVTSPSKEPEVVADDSPIICFEDTDYDYVPPLNTGVLRDAPIYVISFMQFTQRLQASPLWDKVSYATPSGRDYVLGDLHGSLSIVGTGPGRHQINKLIYLRHAGNQLNKAKHSHDLSVQDRFGMIETINIIIDDRNKASEILEELYQKYLVKVENNDVLSDGMTLHAYVRYNDILFELWGINRTQHPIEACNVSTMIKLTIN